MIHWWLLNMGKCSALQKDEYILHISTNVKVFYVTFYKAVKHDPGSATAPR